jgi:hypothetical protein
MPKVVLLLLEFCLSAALVGTQDCQLAGAVAWSSQTRYFVPACENRYLSPDGAWRLTLDDDGRVRFMPTAGEPAAETVLSTKVLPPGIVSWSPTSKALFVDEGQGSAQTSVLRVFVLTRNGPQESSGFGKRLVDWYRRETRCATAAVDPNVWGVGWTADGSRLLVVVQPTIHRPCGQPGSFVALSIDTSSERIVDRLSEKDARREFGDLLWPGIRR